MTLEYIETIQKIETMVSNHKELYNKPVEMSTDRTPYVYIIYTPNHKRKFYIGVRFAKNCNPEDLLESYFTSSVELREYIKSGGITQKTTWACQNIDFSVDLESYLLKTIDAANDELFWNKCNNGNFINWNKHSKERRDEIRQNMRKPKSVKQTEEHRMKNSLANKGKKKVWANNLCTCVICKKEMKTNGLSSHYRNHNPVTCLCCKKVFGGPTKMFMHLKHMASLVGGVNKKVKVNGVVYPTVTAAALANNIHQNTLRDFLKGRSKRCDGIWQGEYI